MAAEAHFPGGSRYRYRRSGPALTAGPRVTARGLAVWVTPTEGTLVDPEIMRHAAQVILERAHIIAPDSEVHWPGSGAATTAAPHHGEVSSGPEVPPSSATQDSPHQADDGGAPHPDPVTGPAAGPVGNVAVDLARGEVRVEGNKVPLTDVEFRLLRYLVHNCSRPVEREELRAFLETMNFPGSTERSIDVYVGRIRRKFGVARHAIATVRGGGYQFMPGAHATVRGPAEYSI